MRDFEESLYVEIRNVKLIRNEIMLLDKRIDFLNEIIDITRKRKFYDVLIDINIENFINLFLKTFLLIIFKKSFSLFKIEFNGKKKKQ